MYTQNFSQWYLRQAIANNLLASLNQNQAPTGVSHGGQLGQVSAPPPPKVVKPVPKHKQTTNVSGLRRKSDEIKQGSRSAFDKYVKQKAAEKETPDFIRGNRIKLKLYDCEGSLPHQKFKNDTQNCSRNSSSGFSKECKMTKSGESINASNPQDPRHEGGCEGSISEGGSERSKASSGKATFKLRTDVVNKTILRAFKKYYIKNFKSFFDFTKIKKSDAGSEEFLAKADEFVTKFLGESKFGDMHIFLASVVDAKKKFSNLSEKYASLKDEINSLVYSFNKRKIEALLSYPEFSNLLLHFLGQESVISDLVKDKSDADTTNVYRKQIEHLKERCRFYLNVSTL